jgi:hypothetical protein
VGLIFFASSSEQREKAMIVTTSPTFPRRAAGPFRHRSLLPRTPGMAYVSSREPLFRLETRIFS